MQHRICPYIIVISLRELLRNLCSWNSWTASMFHKSEIRFVRLYVTCLCDLFKHLIYKDFLNGRTSSFWQMLNRFCPYMSIYVWLHYVTYLDTYIFLNLFHVWLSETVGLLNVGDRVDGSMHCIVSINNVWDDNYTLDLLKY